MVISTSRYEGLSLAHLEALAAGVPVIATDVGGTSEIGNENTGMVLLPADASDDLFAQCLVEVIVQGKRADRRTLRFILMLNACETGTIGFMSAVLARWKKMVAECF